MRGIETRYKGYRFRSRLEARWAVFMDCLGLGYAYELEGFTLPGSGRYLPDFDIPGWDCFVEVKPQLPSEEEARRAWELSRSANRMVLFLAGNPWPSEHKIINVDPDNNFEAVVETLLARGQVPAPYNQFAQCRRCDGICLLLESEDEAGWEEIGPHTCGDHERWPLTGDWAPRIQNAYETAAGARFEYGEAPTARVLPAHRTSPPTNQKVVTIESVIEIFRP